MGKGAAGVERNVSVRGQECRWEEKIWEGHQALKRNEKGKSQESMKCTLFFLTILVLIGTIGRVMHRQMDHGSDLF